MSDKEKKASKEWCEKYLVCTGKHEMSNMVRIKIGAISLQSKAGGKKAE